MKKNWTRVIEFTKKLLKEPYLDNNTRLQKCIWILEFFYFLLLTYNQIWLLPLVDDHQNGYKIGRKDEVTRGQSATHPYKGFILGKEKC